VAHLPLAEFVKLSLHDALPISTTAARTGVRHSAALGTTVRGTVVRRTAWPARTARRAARAPSRRAARTAASTAARMRRTAEPVRSEEHTSERQRREKILCRLLR